MKTSPRSLLVFLISGLLIANATAQQVQPPPLPSARFAKEPGRLVGWGTVAPGVPLTLPVGAAAEGFIAVDAMPHLWVGLKADGKVVVGGDAKRPATKWLNAPVVTAQGKRVIDVAAGQGALLVLYDDGTVDGYGPESASQPPGLTDIIAITGGRSAMGALRKDGKAFVWGGLYTGSMTNPKYSKEVDEQFQQNLASGVAALQCSGEFVHLVKADGKHLLYRFPEWANRSDRLNTEPVKPGSVAIGYFHGYYLNSQGAVKAWAGPVMPDATMTVPSFAEPVVDLRAGGRSGLARLQSGKWVTWGEDGQGLLKDTERLGRLLAFEYQDLHGVGKPEAQHGIVIGIEASDATITVAPVVPTLTSEVPEVAEVLARVERERLAASADLDAWDARYLSELTKLEAKTGGANLKQVAEEKARFRDASRPFSSFAELARLQKIYRDLARGHLAKRDAAILASYEKAAQSLTALADGFTKAGLADKATAVSKERIKVSNAVAALKKQQAAAPATDAKPATPTTTAAAPLAEGQRKFAFTDKLRPGKLVGVGIVGKGRIDVPARTNSRSGVVQVFAGTDNWLALHEDGSVFAQGNGWASQNDVPKNLPPLRAAWARDLMAGVERNGRINVWSVRPAWKNFQKPPAGIAVQEVDFSWAAEHSLAVTPEGGVIGWGPNYQRDPVPWKALPPMTDAVSCATTKEFRCVLRKDGSVTFWGATGELKLPPAAANARFLKIAGSPNGKIFGLVSDGTVRVWGKQEPWAEPPAGLGDVVDIATGPGLFLALRASGDWVGWGHDEDRLLRDLPKLKGVRRLSVGGSRAGGGDEQPRFIIGVRPE